MAVRTNLTIHRGADRAFPLQFYQPGTTTALDITGKAIVLEVLASYPGTPLFSYSVGAGITITSAASGQATVAFDSDDTDIDAGQYYYTVSIPTAGQRDVYAYGVLSILEPEVSGAGV